MTTVRALVCGLGLLTLSAAAPPRDVARLREMLANGRHSPHQYQAAVLLVQDHSPEAEQVIRRQLRQVSPPDVFLALTAALRLCRDTRFQPELFAALASDQADVRRAAAKTLAVLGDGTVLRRLHALANDPAADVAARQAAVYALGRNGSREATRMLLEQAASPTRAVHAAAVEALTELTGQTYGEDLAGWQAWWQVRQDLSAEQWLAERLAYQSSHARRLEGDLEQARTEVSRLHQQLYSRLPAADRLGYAQGLRHHADGRVRLLAAGWCADLWATADAVGRAALAETLLGFSQDGDPEVQCVAVLALGRVNDWRVLDRLRRLLDTGRPSVRAAAARSLTQLASSEWRARKVNEGDRPAAGADVPSARARVIPALQKALDDPALEVVVEAAEDLGSLGVPEAGPVLTALLRHPSESVRQTAARALERVADAAVLDGLLAALNDSSVTVRFSLVGAVGHAVGDGRGLDEAQRSRLLTRLLTEWDRQLNEAKQGAHRLQLLSAAREAWQKGDETRGLVGPVTELLVQADLDEGKWAAALPLVRDLLSRPGDAAEVERRLRWLRTAAAQALRDGNRTEALQAVAAAQPFLAGNAKLGTEFGRLEKQARQAP